MMVPTNYLSPILFTKTHYRSLRICLISGEDHVRI
jgi:hypothetical protein